MSKTSTIFFFASAFPPVWPGRCIVLSLSLCTTSRLAPWTRGGRTAASCQRQALSKTSTITTLAEVPGCVTDRKMLPSLETTEAGTSFALCLEGVSALVPVHGFTMFFSNQCVVFCQMPGFRGGLSCFVCFFPATAFRPPWSGQ